MSEFDFTLAIKELAEAKWPCPYTYQSLTDEHTDHPECGGGCSGTGRIVPFASLQVECSTAWHHEADGEWREVCELDQPQDCKGHNHSYCPRCENRGWVPEPDVEKACWKIWKLLPLGIIQHLLLVTTWEEAILQAAEAWVREQHEPTTSRRV